MEASNRTSVTVAWQVPTVDGGSRITGYRLYMNKLRDGDWELAYDGTNQPYVTIYTVHGLIAGDYYRFRVTSISVRGESADPSPEDTFLCAD